MSARERSARFYATPKGKAQRARALVNAKKKRALARIRKALDDGLQTSSLRDYRRGVLHGLTAARAIAYQHNGGRSWTNAEIAASITDLVADLPAAIVVIGDHLNPVTDEVFTTADIREAFWAPRR